MKSSYYCRVGKNLKIALFRVGLEDRIPNLDVQIRAKNCEKIYTWYGSGFPHLSSNPTQLNISVYA